jgi:hypothetical protein
VVNIFVAAVNVLAAYTLKNDDSTWGIALFWVNIVAAVANLSTVLW